MILVDRDFIRVALAESVRDAAGAHHPTASIRGHLDSTLAWLARAHDQTGNGGVSAGFGRRGWLPDYPEVTGYIIPTLLEYYRRTGQEEFVERAQRMGEYELSIQMKDGAIPGGYALPRSAQVFDTGQVIFGWLALFEHGGDTRYLAAARAAGDWLLSVQSSNGSWAIFDYSGSARAYHSRVSWALIELARVSGQAEYLRAACRQLEWVIGGQRPNGWLSQAELKGRSFPVTHTIAYTIQGLLESGARLEDDRLIGAAEKSARALLEIQLPDGSLHGEYRPDWSPAATWRCLTGCAQMSLCWLHLYEITGEVRYREAALKANLFLRKTQNLSGSWQTRGAIKGSWPFYGRYERLQYPAWAAKFFADALMLELQVTESGQSKFAPNYHG